MLGALQQPLALCAVQRHLPTTMLRCTRSIVQLQLRRAYSHSSSGGGVQSSSGSASVQQARTTSSASGATSAPSHTASSSFFTGRPNARYWPISLSTGANAAAASATGSRSANAWGATRHFSSALTQQIGEYARQPQKGLTLQQLLSVGPNPSKEALLASARFLHRELPIRLAKRVKELESLPYGLSQMPPVQKVRHWYEESFREILSTPEPQTEAEELAFTALLDAIYQRHMDVVPTLAQGVLLMKRELGASGSDVLNQCPFLQDFLDRFHSSRIGIRLLISQHLAIHHPVPGYCGTIATGISPLGVVHDAVSDARRICDREYGWAPEVDVIDETEHAVLGVCFVPTHLHHMVFELLKNSLRAVLEHHGLRNYDAPPIQVVLAEDEKEVSIKVSDQGGGIPRKDMHKIWSYLYTTNGSNAQNALTGQSGSGSNGVVDAAGGHPTNAVGPAGGAETPMSGFGYGLPVSRCFARFWNGGDLTVTSVEGYGTDAYLYLVKQADVNLFLE